MTDSTDKSQNPNVNADHNSNAVGSISVGGDISGNIHIGNVGYTAEEVASQIAQIASTFQPKPFDGRCPYKGLDVFEEEDAELFFGREKLVGDLVSRVKDSRTVFVTGPSGSGKSSLVRAGLIHALKQGAIKGSERWLYATMKPGRDPLESLANAFSRLKSPELGNYFRQHADQVKVLHECAESALTDNKNQSLVLFIDQFEEVFTQISKEEERVVFLNLLTHAATIENGRVIILFSMRSDFVSNCATYPQLNELLNEQFKQIGAMQPEELVSAIAQPALRVGLRIDPDLIAQIINEMKGEPGALPLMQFALKDLFDSQQEKSGVPALILNDYLQRGGIHKALERHADDSFSKLSMNEQELARSIFSGLIEIGRGTQDTKRTALFDELVPANTKAEDVEAIVQKLADARLITTDEQAGKDTVTISHEKLIDAWPWLKKLVNENRDVIALQNEIASDAKEWVEHKRDASYLYSGARLVTAQEKIKDLALSGSAQLFLNTSFEAEEDAKRKSRLLQRRILTGSLTFSAIVLLLLLFAFVQLNVSRAQKLGFQSEVAFAEGNYNAALLYAYQSNLIAKNDAASHVLGLLPYQNFAPGKGLLGHEGSVTSVAWSADGRLASGSDDNTIIIWDLQTGQPAQTLEGHTQDVTSVAWSADGRLASGSSDGTVIRWDLQKGLPAQTLKKYEYAITSLAWSADGQLALAMANAVILWNLKTGHEQQDLFPWIDLSYDSSVAWSADGRLASGTEGGSVQLWDIQTDQHAKMLEGHTSSITSVAWSADGRLASGSRDNTVILWDLQTGQPAKTLKGSTYAITSVAWSADGRLASGSEDGTVTLWDLQTGQPAQALQGHKDAVTSVAWSADGRLASGSSDGTVILWDLQASQSAQSLQGHKDVVTSVAWSADRRLASGSNDKSIILWDLQTGQPAQTLQGHTSSVTSMAWSADGRLASGSNDETIIIWDLQSGQPAQTLQGHSGSVTSVAWSADGRLASGSIYGTVILWDLQTGQPAQTLRVDRYEVTSVAWSADGRLASGLWYGSFMNDDSRINIWDLQIGQPAQTLQGHYDVVTSVAWSADGRLASGSNDKSIILWDLQTGKPAQTLQGHKDAVTSVAWSVDGHLASGSLDKTIILWDLQSGQPAQTLQGHTDDVTSVAWSTDGRLASGSDDGTIKVSNASMTGKDFCDLIFRNMNYREWIDYQGALYTYQPACPNLPTGITDFLTLFFLFTWIGRGLILVLLIMFAASLFWSFRRIQSGSIWWGIGVIGAGIIMITCAISLNLIGLFLLLFFLYGYLLLLNGFTGLLVRSISRRAYWAKILPLAGFVVGLALLLPWAVLEIQVVITRPNSSVPVFLNLLYFAASILGLSTFSLVLWLLFLGGRWAFRKVRKVPDV